MNCMVTTCSNGSKFLVDKKRIEVLKRNSMKYKQLYFKRHTNMATFNLYKTHNSDYNIDVENWKCMRDLCNTIYTVQKEIYDCERIVNEKDEGED